MSTTQRRPWWRRLPFLVLLGGVAVVLGQYWLGLIAIVLLGGDQSRQSDVRVGGALLIVEWMLIWTLPGTSPYLSALLLLAAAAFFLRGAGRIRRTGLRARGPAFAAGACCLLLAALAVNFARFRQPLLDERQALDGAVRARAGGTVRAVGGRDFARYGVRALSQPTGDQVRASAGLVEIAHYRFVQTPFYYVVLFEKNPVRERTPDGEPCFARAETLVVDARDGDVTRLSVDTPTIRGTDCLPLKRGTGRDLLPVAG